MADIIQWGDTLFHDKSELRRVFRLLEDAKVLAGFQQLPNFTLGLSFDLQASFQDAEALKFWG
jgi:hypothetical protein